MSARLAKLIAEARDLNRSLVIVAGERGKTKALEDIGDALGKPTVRLGAVLGPMLAATARDARAFAAGDYLREIAAREKGVALLDNLEILFESGLGINPLDALRGLAHSRVVVAAWPGTYKDGRLAYAPPGHKEHRDYPADGLVVFETRNH